MANDVTPILDFTNQEAVAGVLPQPPSLVSDRTGWKRLTFVHYCHPPHETVEHCLLQHSLVVTAPKRCFRAERRLAGRLIHYAHGSGRIDIIPAFLSHRTSWDREVEFSVIALCPTLLNAAQGQGKTELMPQLAIEDPVIQQLALPLKTEIQTVCLSGELYGEALGTALAERLAQNYVVSRHSPKACSLSQSQLRQVIDYMRANLARNLSIADFATLIDMSESHFSRCFRQSVGISPYRYLTRQRVERAKLLLEQGTKTISAVALDCGFANQTHLTKVFRRVMGVTPSAYQKR